MTKQAQRGAPQISASDADLVATYADYSPKTMAAIDAAMDGSLNVLTLAKLQAMIKNAKGWINATTSSGTNAATYGDINTATITISQSSNAYTVWSDQGTQAAIYDRQMSDLYYYESQRAQRVEDHDRYYRQGFLDGERSNRALRAGSSYKLPDGSVLRVDPHGNYTIEDADKKVTYRRNHDRAFNKYMNASDLMEEFFGFLAANGVTKRTLDQITIRMFVAWIILRAAEEDGEEKPLSEERLLQGFLKPPPMPRPPPPPVPRTIIAFIFKLGVGRRGF